MAKLPTIALDPMVDQLRSLCAHKSVAGDERVLAESAEAIATLLRAAGFEVSLVSTAGAPVLIAERASPSGKHVLFYDHYDIPPPGPWRTWDHEPYSLAEREGALYARGVISKGSLVARLGAVLALAAQGDLPIGVTLLIEGEGLVGSPHLADVVASHAEKLRGELVLASQGSLEPSGRPLLYAGVKGLLQVRLSATGANMTLAPEAAASVKNPIWRLIWALANIKSPLEEILIEDFYDEVEPVSREINRLIGALKLDEQGRLSAWGLESFLIEMTGSALSRTESLTPTCNISSFSAGHGAVTAVPQSANAVLDFTLVPNQQPKQIFELLTKHLASHDFGDVAAEQLPGGFPAARTPLEDPAVERVAAAIGEVYGERPQILPIATFSAPLHLFSAGMRVPALSLGLARPESAVRGANERLLASDLEAMARCVAQLLVGFAA